MITKTICPVVLTKVVVTFLLSLFVILIVGLNHFQHLLHNLHLCCCSICMVMSDVVELTDGLILARIEILSKKARRHVAGMGVPLDLVCIVIVVPTSLVGHLLVEPSFHHFSPMECCFSLTVNVLFVHHGILPTRLIFVDFIN